MYKRQGYDSDIEGYTGANWSIAVGKRALGIGLDEPEPWQADGLVTEFIFRKDTPTRATGRETGGIEPSRRRFRRHAGSYLGVGSAGGASDEVQTESPQTPLDAP